MTATKPSAVFGAIFIWCSSAYAGTLTLHNRDYENGVLIEIRIGNAETCDGDDPQGTRNVPYNESTTINGGTSDVCYRKYDQGNWGAWSRYWFDADDDIN
jgi:hypothetical protein